MLISWLFVRAWMRFSGEVGPVMLWLRAQRHVIPTSDMQPLSWRAFDAVWRLLPPELWLRCTVSGDRRCL